MSDRKIDTEGEETDTAPEAEAVNNDDQFDHYGDYVTRCICGFLHDDGYMIECDRCKVWQHVRCVVRNKQVPEEYLCEVCDPTKIVDRHKARLLQQQWMRETQIAVEAKLRKEGKLNNQLKQKEVLTESDSSDGEQVGKSRLTSTARRKADSQKHGGNSRLRRDSAKEQKRPPKRKDRKVGKRKVSFYTVNILLFLYLFVDVRQSLRLKVKVTKTTITILGLIRNCRNFVNGLKIMRKQ